MIHSRNWAGGDNPQSSKPPHKYPKFDGDLSAERKAYERYQIYFNVPNEI